MDIPKSIFYPTVKSKKEVDINIRKLINDYIFNYWYIYLLFTMLCISAAFFYLKIATPIYEAKSRLLIKEDKNKSTSPEDLLKGLKLFGTSENVANEIHILNSITIMEKVINELNLGISYHFEAWMKKIPYYENFPISVSSFDLSSSVKSSDEYRLNEGLILQINPIDSTKFELIHDNQTVGEFEFDRLFSTSFGTFQIKRLTKLPLATDTTMHITFKDPALVTEEYLKNIKIELIEKEASIIEMSLKETAPDRGIEILNKLVELYNKFTIEDKNKISHNTLNFIEERLLIIAKDLSIVEGNVEKFKKQNEISSTSEKDLEIVLKEVSKYTEAQTELEIQLNILQSMNSYLAPSSTFDLLPANLSVSNKAVKELIESYNKLVLRRQRLLETATISNPLVKSIEQQLTSLKDTIYRTINNVKQDLEQKKKSVSGINSTLAQKIKRVPTQERGLLEIKRQQVIKESLYLFLLKKKEQTALTLAATTSNARIIDPPRITRKPIAPKKSIVYLGSLLGGLLFPFLFFMGRDLWKDSINREEDIKAITSIPIIGNLNKIKDKNKIVVSSNTRSEISERFRLLRSNLQFTNKQEGQRILITSSTSGEGKSFVSVNLALCYSLLKKKTILLGMDLRKPKLTDYLGDSTITEGITEYLVGINSLDEVIQKVEDQPYLDYILCGHTPHNPNELLSRDSVKELFDNLKQQYEVIIIDTAPVGLVSDAFLLSEFSTQTIYVTRSGVTKKQMLMNANEIFKRGRLQEPSILLNGVSKIGRYENSYGYYE